jgi:hypothetical protein
MWKQLVNRVLYGGSKDLRPYEISCLNYLQSALPPDDGVALATQLRAFEFLQRQSNDKLVMFFFREPPEESVLPLIANRSTGLYAARAHLTSEFGTLYCDLQTEKGRVFSLEFSIPPKQLAHQSIECKRIDVNSELLVPLHSYISEEVTETPHILQPLMERFQVDEVIVPVSHNRLNEFLVWLSVPVPQDYVELLRWTNGFFVSGWQFYGTTPRRIILPTSNLTIIAENADASFALCFRDSQDEPVVYLYDEISVAIRGSNTSLLTGFLTWITQPDRAPEEGGRTDL